MNTPSSALARVALVAAAFLTAFGPGAFAQAPPDQPEWYVAAHYQYKPGMVDEAKRLVRDHFWPVDVAVHPGFVAFDFVTGEWHQVAYFPLPGGPGELAGGGQEAVWWAALVAQEGGEEPARQVQGRWQEMVAATRKEIVRRPTF